MHKICKGVIGIVAVAALSSFATAGFAAGPSYAEKRAACSGDAMQFCASLIPDMSRIEGCLRAHRSQLSPTCKALFTKYDRK